MGMPPESLLQLKEKLEGLLDPVVLSQHVAVAATSAPRSHPATTLMHVRFSEDKANVTKLAHYLWGCAQNYSLSRRRREELRKQIEEAPARDLSAVGLISTAVRDAFLEFNKAHPSRSSEVGELLAYCIAVEQLGATQLLAKMALKTNNNMPVHGLDGIHGKVENGWLTLFFLESKLSGSANSGVKDFANSIAGFSNNTKQYQREYHLVRDIGNLDSLDGDDRNLALEYFDVFGTSEIPRRERFVGVILYSDSKAFSSLPPVEDEQAPGFHEQAFSAAYSEQLDGHQRSALRHLNKLGADAAKCRVFFVVVPDANELRDLLYQAMGYVPAKKSAKALIRENPGVVPNPPVKTKRAATKRVRINRGAAE